MTLALILAALATFRVTRLVTTDRIADAPREWMQARFDRLGYLVGCDWCSSMWIAPGPVLLAVLRPDESLTLILLGIPAVSASVGIIATLVDRWTDS